MTDSTNPRVMADNIRELDARSQTNTEEIAKGRTLVPGEEFDTGKTYNGDTVYGKYIEVASLPNNTTAAVNHDISNIGTVLNAYLSMQLTASIPGRLIIGNNLRFTATQVTIQTASDFSGNSGIIYLEYTKATTP